MTTPAQTAQGRRAALAHIAAARARAAVRLDDLEWLAQTGATREDAARRAGFPSLAALERFISRHGRHDLRGRLPLRTPTAGRWAA